MIQKQMIMQKKLIRQIATLEMNIVERVELKIGINTGKEHDMVVIIRLL